MGRTGSLSFGTVMGSDKDRERVGLLTHSSSMDDDTATAGSRKQAAAVAKAVGVEEEREISTRP